VRVLAGQATNDEPLYVIVGAIGKSEGVKPRLQADEAISVLEIWMREMFQGVGEHGFVGSGGANPFVGTSASGGGGVAFWILGEEEVAVLWGETAGLKDVTNPFVGHPSAEHIRHIADKDRGRLLGFAGFGQAEAVEGRGESKRPRDDLAVLVGRLGQDMKAGDGRTAIVARGFADVVSVAVGAGMVTSGDWIISQVCVLYSRFIQLGLTPRQ